MPAQACRRERAASQVWRWRPPRQTPAALTHAGTHPHHDAETGLDKDLTMLVRRARVGMPPQTDGARLTRR
jgi:hypothetical protein